MKDIKMEDILPITAEQYFKSFIMLSEVKVQYLLSKGHTDVDVGTWQPCSKEGMFERVSNFTTNLSNNVLVKKLTGSVSLKVKEVQRYHFDKYGDLFVQSDMTFGGSSIADSFSSHVEWIAHTLPNSQSELKCNVKTEYRGYMFKGLIEKYAHQAACDSFHHWLKAVREKLASLQQVEIETKSAEDQTETFTEIHSETEEDDSDDEFFDSIDVQQHETTTTEKIVGHGQTTTVTEPPLSTTTNSTTYTIRPPIHTSTNNYSQAIYATYSAGRKAATQNNNSNPSSSSNNTSSLSSLYALSKQQPTLNEVKEKYKKKMQTLVAEHRAKERNWESNLQLVTQKVDVLLTINRRLFIFIGFFMLVWPILAKRLGTLWEWLWPLLSAKLRKR